MADQTQPRAEFFYDIGSPYAYLAATQIEEVARRCGVAVRWRPFLLGAVFQATGNVPPATVPAKARWMLRDLQSWADLYGVGFTFPAALFPVNALRAVRACTWAQSQGAAAQRALAMSLFEDYWVNSQDPSSPEAITRAAQAAGLDPEQALAATQDPAIKAQLRQDTEEAVRRGAFGAPTIYLDGDAVMLWGNDRLPIMEHYFKAQEA
jgi:2-hydroxychromene-2-carboxylate isomerase